MEDEKKLTGYPSIDKPWLKYYKNVSDFSVPKCKIYDYMKECTKSFDNYTAINYFGKKITYKSMHKKIEKVSKALKSFDVQEGDIVSVCLPNTPEVVYVFYAINRIGAIANMLDPRSSETSLKQALIDAKSKMLITLNSVENKFYNIISDTDVKHVISVSALESLPLFIKLRESIKLNKSSILWRHFLKRGNKYNGIIDSKYCPDMPAVIAYTGGTTGIPKGVITSNENLNAIIAMNEKNEYKVYPKEKSLDIAPPWTYYGLNNCLNAFLCMGQEVMLIPKIGPDELGEIIFKVKPNHIITVPSALVSVMNCSKLADENLSYIKTIIVGADKLDETFESEFNDFLRLHNSKAVITKGYGMTELTAAATYTKDNCNGIGSVGIPYIGNTVSAFDMDTSPAKELHIGERGEIAITGPTVMLGYFGSYSCENNTVLQKHQDGFIWVHTGDIGHIDENGKLYIDGRVKRMFVKNGFKIFPAEVERQIMKHKDVINCAVIAVANSSSGNVEKAFVVTSVTDKDRLKQELLTLISDNLYDYEIPESIDFIEKLPLTGMGKIDYRTLEKMTDIQK